MSLAGTAVKRPSDLQNGMDRFYSDAASSKKIRQLDRTVSVSDEPRRHVSSPTPSANAPLHRSATRFTSQSPSPSSRNFDPDASLVLIGQRGAGKSSLAVIASAALRRRFVDVDLYFEKTTGMSRAGFIRKMGMNKYRTCELEVMTKLLTQNQKGCIIAGVFGVESGNRHSLLRNYCKTNPVVYILRESHDLQQFVQVDEDKMQQIIEIAGPLHRASSNFEFFNLSWPHRRATDYHSPAPSSLKLKDLEQDFVRFLSSIYGKHSRLSHTPVFNSTHTLSHRADIESRKYTYALDVTLEQLRDKSSNFSELDCGADAINFKLRVPSKIDNAAKGDICRAMSLLRRVASVPIIYSVEGYHQSVIDEYTDLLNLGLRLGPEYLSISLDCPDTTIRYIMIAKGQTKLMADYLDSDPGSDGWSGSNRLGLYNRAKKLGFDIVRLSQPANSASDNLLCLQFAHSINSNPDRIPLVAYNTGRLGRMSVCFNPILSPVALEPAPDSVTLQECQHALYSSFVLEKRKFFIFGSSVSYSLSPAMHNAAFQACGMPHDFEIIQSDNFGDIRRLLQNQLFGGAAITLPYKREILSLLQSMSVEVQVIGAVNTLIPMRSPHSAHLPIESHWRCPNDRNGPITHLHGCNTDWKGIYACVHSNLSPANAIRPDSTGLIIGAGGMARAAIFACLKLGLMQIFIYNRTVKHARELAAYYNSLDLSSIPGVEKSSAVSIIESLDSDWPSSHKQPTVIASCVPAHSIGRQPPPDFQLPGQWLLSRTGGVVVELAYKPLNTLLLQQMRQLSNKGWIGVDGLDVLVEQGMAMYELFNGRTAPSKLMKRSVRQRFQEIQSIR